MHSCDSFQVQFKTNPAFQTRTKCPYVHFVFAFNCKMNQTLQVRLLTCGVDDDSVCFVAPQPPAGSYAEAGRPERLSLPEGGPVLPAALAAALPSGPAEGSPGGAAATT